MRKASTRLPEQGTQTPSPAPDLIPAEPKNQPRNHIAIGTANGGTSKALTLATVEVLEGGSRPLKWSRRRLKGIYPGSDRGRAEAPNERYRELVLKNSV
jgi:hypothetical protein